MGWTQQTSKVVGSIDVKNVILRFFLFWSRYFTFLTFFLFSERFFIFKKRWQSSERQAD